jgi:hypothetical protein
VRYGAVIPENVLRLMSPDDRAALGKAGRTFDECEEVRENKAEKDLQDDIEQWCVHQSPPVVCYRQRMDRKSNMRVGTPDLLICAAGRFIGLECKVGKNKPTDDQERELKAIQSAGGTSAVVRSLAEAKRIIKNEPF